jgi:hypothetical protein
MCSSIAKLQSAMAKFSQLLLRERQRFPKLPDMGLGTTFLALAADWQPAKLLIPPRNLSTASCLYSRFK